MGIHMDLLVAKQGECDRRGEWRSRLGVGNDNDVPVG